MKKFNKTQLNKIAKEQGFVRDTYEKVLRLKYFLNYVYTDEFLSEHLALKGGTTINLILLKVPRLSVDIDFDFIPNCSLAEMKEFRYKITEVVNNKMKEDGYTLITDPNYSFSLDSFGYQYLNVGGNKDIIKIEINYSLRSHLFPPVKRNLRFEEGENDPLISILDPIEIFAAKINALLGRTKARDLLDCVNLIKAKIFTNDQYDLLRKAVIFYYSISQKEVNPTFDLSPIKSISYNTVKRDLFPVMRKEEVNTFDLVTDKELVLHYLKDLLVLTPSEKEYLTKFKNKEYYPELLFDDKEIIDRIKDHPMVRWKLK